MILKDKVVIITGAGPGMGQAAFRGAAVPPKAPRSW